MIIGAKVKMIDDPAALKATKFNDEYYSNLMLQEINKNFFMETSVIRIIEQ